VKEHITSPILTRVLKKYMTNVHVSKMKYILLSATNTRTKYINVNENVRLNNLTLNDVVEIIAPIIFNFLLLVLDIHTVKINSWSFS